MQFRATDDEHSATTLELFFDLVFVFAFTQVTELMARNPTTVGGLRGLVLMALLWWAWCSYTWLGNQAHAEEGIVRATMLLAMAAMFLVALAIPESFSDLPGGLFDPAVLAIFYVVVRALHLACSWVDRRRRLHGEAPGRGDGTPRRPRGGPARGRRRAGPAVPDRVVGTRARRRLRRRLARRHGGLAGQERRATSPSATA